MAQVIQGFGIIMMYFLVWYMVYVVKCNFHTWKDDINMMRIWFFIECTYLFNYIVASCIFTMTAQLLKFKSSVKNDQDTLHDDNVWNDKETDDYLRYIKYDFFIFTYIIASLLTNLMFGYADSKDLKQFDP